MKRNIFSRNTDLFSMYMVCLDVDCSIVKNEIKAHGVKEPYVYAVEDELNNRGNYHHFVEFGIYESVGGTLEYVSSVVVNKKEIKSFKRIVKWYSYFDYRTNYEGSIKGYMNKYDYEAEITFCNHTDDFFKKENILTHKEAVSKDVKEFEFNGIKFQLSPSKGCRYLKDGEWELIHHGTILNPKEPMGEKPMNHLVFQYNIVEKENK